MGLHKTDWTGKRFGRLVMISFSHKTPKNNYWLCKCDCGNEKIVRVSHLTSNNVRSCGCMVKERGRKMLTTHGMSKYPEHAVWTDARHRCEIPTHHAYPDYGGRGICVCERWSGEDGFINFIEDMGRRPSDKHQLDRIDNDGNYTPFNCRWATRKMQMGNTRANKWITYNGETMIQRDWEIKLGIKQRYLSKYLKYRSFEEIANKYLQST